MEGCANNWSLHLLTVPKIKNEIVWGWGKHLILAGIRQFVSFQASTSNKIKEALKQNTLNKNWNDVTFNQF